MLMNEGEVRTLILDLAPMLETGETITTATVAAAGITASISNTTSTVTLTLSVPTAYGEATPTITLSTGEKIIETIHARQNGKDGIARVAYAL